MPETINDLRTHLFQTLKALRDPNSPMDLQRARSIADVGRVIVETAKVEVDFLRVTGGLQSTGFLPDADAEVDPRKGLAAAPTNNRGLRSAS